MRLTWKSLLARIGLITAKDHREAMEIEARRVMNNAFHLAASPYLRSVLRNAWEPFLKEDYPDKAEEHVKELRSLLQRQLQRARVSLQTQETKDFVVAEVVLPAVRLRKIVYLKDLAYEKEPDPWAGGGASDGSKCMAREPVIGSHALTQYADDVGSPGVVVVGGGRGGGGCYGTINGTSVVMTVGGHGGNNGADGPSKDPVDGP